MLSLLVVPVVFLCSRDIDKSMHVFSLEGPTKKPKGKHKKARQNKVKERKQKGAKLAILSLKEGS